MRSPDIRYDRRQILRTFGLILVASQLPHQSSTKNIPIDDVNQLGLNYLPDKIRWYGLNESEVRNYIAQSPFKHLRIAIDASVINHQPNRFDFDYYDRLVTQMADAQKLITLQPGTKTFGGDEINLADHIKKRIPEVTQPGALDKSTAFREYNLELHHRIAEHFYPQYGPEIVEAIHPENEAHSKRLNYFAQITNGQYLTPKHLDHIIEIIKQHDPYHRPITQNFPWDSPEYWLPILKNPNIDIVSLNIYNNARTPAAAMPLAQSCAKLVRVFNKRLRVSEYQTAPWLNQNRQPKYPFDSARFFSGLDVIQSINPEVISFWDIEQHIWHLKNQQDQQYRLIIEHLQLTRV